MSDQESFGKRLKRGLELCAQVFVTIFVMPFVLYGLYAAGIGGPWIAGVVMIVFAIAAIKPRSAPFMEVPIVSKSIVVGALFALVFILFDMNGPTDKEREEKLANLKIFSPEAYVDKLKSLGRDDEWFAALEDVRPEEYAAEKVRRDEKIRLRQVREAVQARKDRISQLYKKAGDKGRHGITLKASDYEGTWNLSVREGRLHCKQGPMANGKPRPLVLFDAGGKSYGINGAAMTNGYADARTLLAGDAGVPPYDDKMLDPLLTAGLTMCKKTLIEICGGEFSARRAAIDYVQTRLKSPSTADFPLLDMRYAMLECGVWSVRSYVDSQNTFGATIRTNFTAIVERKANGTWIPIDLETQP